MTFLHKTVAFRLRAGTGTQAVTGFGFMPKVVMFFGSDTTFGGADGSAAMVSYGFDDGVSAYGRGVENFDNRVLGEASSGSLIGASIVRVNSTALTPNFMLEGRITSLDADGFTINLSVNTQSLQEWFFATAFGGSDLEYALLTFVPPSATGLQTISGLSFAPTALISIFLATPSAVGPDLTCNLTFISATNSVTLATTAKDAPGIPSENYRYLRNGRAFADVAIGGAVLREALTVTLTSDGWITNWTTATGGVPLYAVLALGGSVSGADAGVYAQQTTASSQVVSTLPINPVACLFGSVSAVASTTVGTGFSFSMGAADAAATQGGAWAGAVNGVNPTVCARSMSHSALVSGFPPAVSGGSTTLVLVEDFVSADTASFTMTDTVADGLARQIMYLALGTSAPPPPPANEREAIRFVRVFPHVNDKNLNLFCSRLEFACQRGVGTISGQGVDPQAMVSISRDYGETWGPTRFLSMGEIGEYLQRVYLIKLGRARDFTFKLVVTDPVLVAFLNADIDLEEGSS